MLAEQKSLLASPPGKEMAVAQKAGIPKWVALVSGNMDENPRFAPPIV